MGIRGVDALWLSAILKKFPRELMGIVSERPELTEKGLQFILMVIASDFVICEIIEKILQIILIGVVVWLH